MEKMQMFQCQNNEGFPGVSPSTDFKLLFPFQIIIDPRLQRKADSDWLLLAPWQDLIAMKIRV